MIVSGAAAVWALWGFTGTHCPPCCAPETAMIAEVTYVPSPKTSILPTLESIGSLLQTSPHRERGTQA